MQASQNQAIVQPQESSSAQNKNDLLSVVIGTYHSCVAHFTFDLDIGDCQQLWIDSTSAKAVKTINFNGYYVIFGGSDEIIRIIDISKRKENVGVLYEHQGSITHLSIFQNSHLFSSSEDGNIHIWQMNENNNHKNKKAWESLCCMSSSPISSIISFSVHPSGRLLLSINNLQQLKIWDLIRGICIITVHMPASAIDVQWSPDGNTYCIVRQNKILIYTKEGILYKVMKPLVNGINNDNSPIFVDRYQSTILSFTYILHDMIAIADMSARIVVYDIESKQPLMRLLGHENENSDENNSRARVRCLKTCNVNDCIFMVSVDNHGRICIWNIHDCLSQLISFNSVEDGIDDGVDVEQNTNVQLLTADNKNDEDDDDDDVMIDEYGLYSFSPLMQVDTDTHITCMDVGIVGRFGHLYKWKKPKQQMSDVKEMEFEDEENENENNIIDVDSDSDDEQREKREKRKKKKKKKKKKKSKIDFSRFD